MYNPVDHFLLQQFSKKKINVIETPNFLTSEEELRQYYETVRHKKKPFYQTSFYKWQRNRFNILPDSKLSYDKDNRKSISKGTIIPDVDVTRSSKDSEYIIKAIQIVEKEFPYNYGTCDNFWCPITFTEAKKWLDCFISERLKNFGTYQDAVIEPTSKNTFLFHSGISSSLNIGLLDPKYVIQKILDKRNKITINNIEGFINDVISNDNY